MLEGRKVSQMYRMIRWFLLFVNLRLTKNEVSLRLPLFTQICGVVNY